MRFSLKWILAAMAYMAIAAAAFTQTTWVYADLLWAASLLAVVYAALVTAFARGRRQLIAAGFVAASLCFCACLNVGGADAVPTMRLLAAAGVGRQPIVVQPYAPQPVQVSRMVQGANGRRQQVVETAVAAPMPAPTPAASPTTYAVYPPPLTVSQWMAMPRVDMESYRRAGNAVGMMLVGGLGSIVGLAAHRAVRRERQDEISTMALGR